MTKCEFCAAMRLAHLTPVRSTKPTARPSSATSQPAPGSRPGKSLKLIRVAAWKLNGSDDKFAFEGSCVCSGGTLTDEACSSNDNKMKDWNEWWLDLHSDSCKVNVQNVMAARIGAARGKGCDGVDPDNVDSVSRSGGYARSGRTP